ncbi:unnamed protein product [Chondrus crispus]|uniref:Uncharacterized protein n=1 Tax=Chondrus crispus TaxID=2769 RepID=R7QLV8_CHOCR|nr:unnamed protein product [Chondrus crispus]CDF39074.1 unnamed protein product [Chondrus crispus]|eukprot:XP_005718985.1 unnamed protein product [Chondrus crispus]
MAGFRNNPIRRRAERRAATKNSTAIGETRRRRWRGVRKSMTIGHSLEAETCNQGAAADERRREEAIRWTLLDREDIVQMSLLEMVAVTAERMRKMAVVSMKVDEAFSTDWDTGRARNEHVPSSSARLGEITLSESCGGHKTESTPEPYYCTPYDVNGNFRQNVYPLRRAQNHVVYCTIDIKPRQNADEATALR